MKSYQRWSVCMVINNWVPNWVEIASTINRWNTEGVSTSVSLGVSWVNSAWSVEWLMNISKIVNKESKGVWLCVIFVVDVLHNGLVGEAVLVSWIAWKPVDECWDNFSNVLVVLNETWEIINWTTLIKEWGVNEMPARLVRTSLCLDLIGEGWALNEWVVTFEWGHAWVWVRVDWEHVVCCLEGWWSFLV